MTRDALSSHDLHGINWKLETGNWKLETGNSFMLNAIALSHVTKQFNGTVAVDDLSLSVPAGSIYGFIGPNGSGKTTTLRMIMHILLPDRGEI